MPDFEDNFEITDTLSNFDTGLSNSEFTNQRLATRYIRNDIKTVFYKIDFFTSHGFNYFRRLIKVELLDISSKGVLISTDNKLKQNTKIVLGLKFKSGKSFRIKAEVVRKSTFSDYEYGIKFDEYNDDLGDYLLQTQTELRFK